MNNNITDKYSKDDAYKVLELTNSWISNVDTKASFGLAFIVALLSIIFYNAGTTPAAFQELIVASIEKNITCCVIIKATVVMLMYLSCLASIILFFLSIIGRINNNAAKKSMLFFGTISSLSINDFKVKVLNMNDKDLTKDILEQAHINSCICAKKFSFYNKGLWTLLISVILFFICMMFNMI